MFLRHAILPLRLWMPLRAMIRCHAAATLLRHIAATRSDILRYCCCFAFAFSLAILVNARRACFTPLPRYGFYAATYASSCTLFLPMLTLPLAATVYIDISLRCCFDASADTYAADTLRAC